MEENGGYNMKKAVVAVVIMMVGMVAFAKSMKIAGSTTQYIKMWGPAKETGTWKLLLGDGYFSMEEGSDINTTVYNYKFKFKYSEVAEKKREKVEAKLSNELLEIVRDNLAYEEQRARLTEVQIAGRSAFSDINHKGYYTDSLATVSFDKDCVFTFYDCAELEELVKSNYKAWMELPLGSDAIKGLDAESRKYGITIYWDKECESFYVLNYLEVKD